MGMFCVIIVAVVTRPFVRAHQIVCFKLVNIIVYKLYSNKASFFKRRKDCDWSQGKRAEALGTEPKAGGGKGWVWPCPPGRGVIPLGSRAKSVVNSPLVILTRVNRGRPRLRLCVDVTHFYRLFLDGTSFPTQVTRTGQQKHL